jgi:hypothetical protein
MFTFKFATNFPELSQIDFDFAYDIITTMFVGVSTLWANYSYAESKRSLLYNYLVAWYLADTRPDKVIGIPSDGGKPVNHKEIGGVAITYRPISTQPGLEMLTTNVFGLQALQMYLGCPERFMVH